MYLVEMIDPLALYPHLMVVLYQAEADVLLHNLRVKVDSFLVWHSIIIVHV